MYVRIPRTQVQGLAWDVHLMGAWDQKSKSHYIINMDPFLPQHARFMFAHDQDGLVSRCSMRPKRLFDECPLRPQEAGRATTRL